MTDFAALLDRVIAREIRGHLTQFLTSYEHVEFGRARPLDVLEIALVLTALDSFLMEDSLTSLEVPDIRRLHLRLRQIAGHEGTFGADEACRARNACFDALACLKALEARLSSQLHKAAILRRTCRSPPAAAND
jgi:hypothetical protein